MFYLTQLGVEKDSQIDVNFHSTLLRENHDFPSNGFEISLRFFSKPANRESIFERWDESSGSLRSSRYSY